jgi:hypothetical protein
MRTLLASACAALLLTSLSLQAADAAKKKVPLELKLPVPAFIGTPADIQPSPHLEMPSENPRPPFLVPEGVKNVAAKKKVTASDKSPLTGKAELLTDGDKEATDESVFEMHRKLQWVQIDLEATFEIHVILVWHAHNTPQVYHDVIVQVADDPDFTKNVQTVYNNDYDNTAGLGIGKDKEYFENYEGRLMDAKGVKGRYVRLYSNGSTYSGLNVYTEVEVHGLPVTQ